jgi:signal transduction histidine kinase/ligand-binding sensor domain-containing protein/ActR/RegA family two-component response regulator
LKTHISETWLVMAVALVLAPAGRAEHYRFRHFGPEEGLNTAVSRLLQDRTGFLWVGTGNGLFRYDGAHFQHFGAEDGLPSASIRCMKEASDGTLWVATGKGLARLGANAFEPIDIGIAAQDLRAMDIGSDGRLYLGFDRGILVSTQAVGRGKPVFQAVPGAPSAAVDGVYAEPAGPVWFGSQLKLYELDNGRLRVWDEDAGLPRERWTRMLRDANGDLWVRGSQHLYVQPSGVGRFVPRDEGLPQSSNIMTDLQLDSAGVMMVTTDRGLARWIDGRWSLVGTAQGLESDTVTSVLQDREGSLWIGLWGAGIARWPGPTQWSNWTIADGLSNNIIWAVRRHPSGSLWIGTDRGLVKMQDGAVQKIWLEKDGLAGDKVKALVTGPDGALWVGCLPGGVSRIDPVTGQIRNYGVRAGLEDDRVIALYIDREQRLWASTSEGLFRSTSLGPNLRFERQTPPGTREGTMYFRFRGDRSGRMWVGGVQGLFCWDRGKWTNFTKADGLKSDGVTQVGEAGDGSIWIAYREPVGVSQLTFSEKGMRIRHFSKEDGLASDYILFLGLDSRSQLWVGTDNGVSLQTQGGWTNFTHEDGLVWDDCAANAFWPEPDGSVWIGTLKGLAHYRPDIRTPRLAGPPAVITEVKFGGQRVGSDGPIQVPFRQHDFAVSFSGLTFLSERNVRFRYRLLGLEDEWVETDLREARYSSLPAGSYQFDVMARKAKGVWSPAPASLSFRVIPPWWQASWFRCLAAAGLLAMLLSFLTLLLKARMTKMMREHKRLESAVRERTGELELQKNLVERQKVEIEELLRQAQEVSRLKSEFLANMSHEIRTPMNGVIGMTQLALNTSLNEEQRDYMSTVRDSADSLLVIINDILDFSKIEAGKMELLRQPFHVRKCVSDSLLVFSWKAREKKLELRHCVSPEVPEVLVGDADRLRQVLLNLIGNAMKFTERGSVAVNVSMDSGATSPDRPVLRFSVSDTGCGIPYDKQNLIFEAFAQVDGSPTRRQGGTGLGLAISSKLVRLMEGQIAVESTPGVGSTFSFTATMAPGSPEMLPVDPRPLETGKVTGPSTEPFRKLRILLAEDNVVNQKLAARIIEKLGHSLLVVGNGAEAVRAVERETFDLVLMDWQMPEMGGLEATALIREAERQAAANGGRHHTPIIAMTAHAMSGDRESCLQSGMDDYLSKPISVPALVEKINKIHQPVG